MKINQKKHIFISHSSKDKLIATYITKYLKSLGFSVWIDHEQIKYGSSIPTEIQKGLNNAFCIITLISSNFIESSWCRGEYEPFLMREFSQKKTYIVPVLVKESQIPILLYTKKYCSLIDPNFTGEELTDLQKFQLRLLSKDLLTLNNDIDIMKKIEFNSKYAKLAYEGLNDIHSFIQNFNRKKGHDVLNNIKQFLHLFESQLDIAIEMFNTPKSKQEKFLDKFRVYSINRKLVNIFNEMSSLSKRVKDEFKPTNNLSFPLEKISSLCYQIVLGEGNIVISLIRKTSDDMDENSLTVAKRWGINTEILIEKGLGDVSPYFDLDLQKEYNFVLIKLNNLKIELEDTILKL